MTTDELFDAFQNPGPPWRGKPFWAWNGRLDKAELIRQVHVMKAMGLGGFFMHSRVGLATEYLGDDWFECINACADEAEELGMEAWLYDEDRWPSGTAGGLVTENPDFRMRYLRLAVVPGDDWTWRDDCLAVFACELDGLSYTALRRIGPGSAIPPGFSVLAFTVEEMARSNFYNGYTYLDTMNRAATDAFLALTHEKYARRCGGRLGKSIKGIFTDEPHRGSLMTSFGQGLAGSEWLVPWTPRLPEHWEAAWGDDLIAHLPEVFLQPDGRTVHPTKWRYVELCLQLFIENFCKPMDDWCRAHGIILTGHFLHEDNLTAQVAMNGSMLRCYAHMEWPGMDLLGEGNRAFWVAKQLQSAGRQLGRPWLMSELYGCTGWQMGLEGHKHVGDWQALLGVNVRCHHLSWFTMEGEAKRDYPASILHQSAWWKDYGAVETYFARLGLLLAQGEPVCETLVIHPVESLWAQIHPGWCDGLGPRDPEIQKLERDFADLFHRLQGAQIDFDYGDEGILAEHGRIDGDAFVVGCMRYRTVVIGGCTTIRSTTLRLLEAFAAAGGKVVWVGDRPSYIDAEPAELREFGEALDWDQQWTATLEGGIHLSSLETGAGYIVETGAPEVFAQRRRLDDGRAVVVLLNTDRERPKAVRWRAPLAGIEAWNCLTGERRPVPRDPDGIVALSLPPGGEAVLVASLAGAPSDEARADWTRSAPTPLPGPFPFTLDEPNVLVLDFCDVTLDGAPLGRHEILKADRTVRERFGLEPRGGEMVQPWYAAKFQGEPPVLGRLTLRFDFEAETPPSGPLFLALERPDRFQVSVNGTRLTAARDAGWWVDACLRKLPVPADALRTGANYVEVSCDFRRDIDLEALFLLGDFGVRLDGSTRTLTALPPTLAVGDLCSQGLPFYSGCVTYRVPTAGGELVLPSVGGACVRLDGKTIPWPPYRGAASGPTCAVTVVLTRRNSFGPLHLVPKVHGSYGPGHWVTGGASWSDDYQLFPSGLLAPPELG